MPQYILLIHAPAERRPSPEELQTELPRWFAYTEELRAAGAMVAGEALEPVAAARTVRVRDGERRVSAGSPEATAEVLTGFYVIDVADTAAAEDWAARIPSVTYGSVEVRPIMVFAESEPAGAESAKSAS